MEAMYDERLRSIMDKVLKMSEHAHHLMVELASEAGFSRKRAHELTAGDEIGYGANEWRLVIDVEESATPEGDGIIRVLFIDADDATTDHLFDPLDIVDVKAVPTPEPF